MSYTGIAVMIGKCCIVLLGLLIAVIAWRWRNGIEVKHSPRRLVSDAIGYTCETVTEKIAWRAAERGKQ